MPAYARLGSLTAVALAAFAVLTTAQPAASLPAAPAPTTPGAAPVIRRPLAAESFRSSRGYDAVPAPVRLRIPALRVDSRLQPLGRQADGSIAVPTDAAVAGWYVDGPRPGQPGPAVILGHVDSHTGPGVFAGLAQVRDGTEVRVDRADGSAVTFRVTGVSRVPKDEFPTDQVYAPTLDPALRLVTCGGGFDRARGSYRDNVIAFADRA